MVKVNSNGATMRRFGNFFSNVSKIRVTDTTFDRKGRSGSQYYYDNPDDLDKDQAIRALASAVQAVEPIQHGG